MQLFHFQISCTVLTKMLENFCIPPSFSPISSSCCFPGTGLKEKGAGGYERKHLFLISTDEGKQKKRKKRGGKSQTWIDL
jgi:hypothetical protein